MEHADYTRTVDTVQVGEIVADDASYSRLRITERREVRGWVSFTAIHLDTGAPVERTWSRDTRVTVYADAPDAPDTDAGELP